MLYPGEDLAQRAWHVMIHRGWYAGRLPHFGRKWVVMNKFGKPLYSCSYPVPEAFCVGEEPFSILNIANDWYVEHVDKV